jgi:hypothetical protein
MPPSTPNGNNGAAFRARLTPSTCTPPAAGGGNVAPSTGAVVSPTALLVDWRPGPSLGPPRQTGGAEAELVADGADGPGAVDGTGGSGCAGIVGRPTLGRHLTASAPEASQVAGVPGGVTGGLLGGVAGGVTGGVDGDEVGGVTVGVPGGVPEGEGDSDATGAGGGSSSAIAGWGPKVSVARAISSTGNILAELAITALPRSSDLWLSECPVSSMRSVSGRSEALLPCGAAASL